jgi:hypothetical protein
MKRSEYEHLFPRRMVRKHERERVSGHDEPIILLYIIYILYLLYHMHIVTITYVQVYRLIKNNMCYD